MDNADSGLTKKILIGMVAGLVFGLLFHYAGKSQGIADSGAFAFIDNYVVFGLFHIIGKVFIASLKVLVVPLVFVSLVCGVSAIKDSSTIGVISIKTLALYCFTTAMAIALALLVATIVSPGMGVEDIPRETFTPKIAPGMTQVFIDIFPTNIVGAMADGKMLQIIVFALLLGVAINHAGDDAAIIKRFFTALDKVIMRFVLLVMRLAPYGVFCLLALLFAKTGPENISKLAKYFFTVLTVLLLHGLGVFSILLMVFTRLNPLVLLKKMRKVWLFAFSTASSNATIPVTLNVVEKQLGVSNKVASFTVPLGATINMDGTAIMQGVATVFIAQVYGIDIGLAGYLTVIATATLASIGTAGVPGVGLITLALVLEQVGLPVEGIALIIGIDRLLDMVRTAVNVTGDAVVSTIVARSSGDFDENIFYADEADLGGVVVDEPVLESTKTAE